MKTLQLSVQAILFAVLFPFVSMAQTDLNKKVPLDPDVRFGVLENGMTYYIRHNQEPKERASFYIIQNVGALLENDEQNGLAHFLEHMAFNGTENFKGKGILNTLEKHGVAFGRNINAYTSFEETVYNMSDVPTTNESLMDTCLLILHDWSDRLLLQDDEIDKERGVILEEWRTRRTSSTRMRDQWFPVLFKGSKYAVRDIIGDTMVIKYHKPETLRKFYHDWYRTDLQAIAVVGDFDADEMERKVKKLFSDIQPVENPAKRPKEIVPHHNETYFVTATDKEATQAQISIYIVSDNNDGQEKTYNDLRNDYVRSLYNSMSGNRISELLQKGVPPFISGYTRMGKLVRGYDTYNIGATANPNPDGLTTALEAIMIETERIKQHGFTDGELERVKANLLTNLENQKKQKDKIRNDSYANQFMNHYLTKSVAIDIDDRFDFVNEILKEITADEVSAKAKEWIVDSNRTIVITGPAEGVEYPDKDKIMEIIDKVKQMEIEPYVDDAGGKSLVDDPLEGSPVVKTVNLEQFEAVEWTLANNVKVVYRHADYEKDNVQLSAFSYGGTSIWDDRYIPSLEMTTSFVSSYGVGDFDAIMLRKMLSGKRVRVAPSVGSIMESFSGNCSPNDFETMLQLIYLYFEKPRFDQEAHDALKARYKAMLTNMQNDPDKIKSDSITLILSDYNPRVRNMNESYLEEVNMEDIEKIYRDRIKDAGDFVFLIVGNVDVQTVKPLVEKYLGSLTDDPRTETWIDRGVKFPKGETVKNITLPLAVPKANVNIYYSKEMDYNAVDNLKNKVLEGILRLRYTETIREDEGGTYGVGVGSSFSKYPVSKVTFRINFDCDPLKADHLKSIIYREIDKIREDGPTAEDFDKTIKNMQKEREQSREHNSFWLSSLYNYYTAEVNFADPKNFEDLLKDMKVSDIREFARNLFRDIDKVEIVFRSMEE